VIIKNKLACHTGTACLAVQRLNVELETLRNGNLRLRYALTGDPAQLLIPAPLPPEMADGLWQHTCFEAFIAAEGDDRYHEFNFSPSGQWAAYAFSGYRVHRDWTASRTPGINFTLTDKRLLLEADIAAEDLPSNLRNKPFELGLAAVIETADGQRSYWALHHPAANPDFHHRGGFVQSFKTATFIS
jgi:hypothetical protein